MSNEALQIVQSQAFRLIPATLGEAMEMAKLISGSELCPKSYRGKPADCIVAYDFGRPLGLSWMQSLRYVSVINGQAALWGDAVPAVIQGSGECERFHESFDGTPYDDAYTAVCIIKRKGMKDEVVRRFSVADAKLAKLWGKRGREGQDTPWITYPARMLQMRARGFAARDSFADKLAGLILAEEAEDYPPVVGQVPASESPAGEVTVAPGVAALQQLPEPMQENIEKAFATLNLAPGLRLAKLNEFLLTGEGTGEEKAGRLLEWLRDEYAKRQGRERGQKKGTDNGKKSAAVEPAGQGTSSAPAPVTSTTPVIAQTTTAPDAKLGF